MCKIVFSTINLKYLILLYCRKHNPHQLSIYSNQPFLTLHAPSYSWIYKVVYSPLNFKHSLALPLVTTTTCLNAPTSCLKRYNQNSVRRGEWTWKSVRQNAFAGYPTDRIWVSPFVSCLDSKSDKKCAQKNPTNFSLIKRACNYEKVFY